MCVGQGLFVAVAASVPPSDEHRHRDPKLFYVAVAEALLLIVGATCGCACVFCNNIV